MTTSRLPAIYFFRAGSKDNPEAYEGTKDAESLEAFIDEKVRKGSGAPVYHRRPRCGCCFPPQARSELPSVR